MLEVIFYKTDAVADCEIHAMTREESKGIAFKCDVPFHPHSPG